MSREVSIVLAGALLIVTNCARQVDGQGTTTVTSGATSSVKVTGIQVERDAVGMRLADEICTRETACNHVGSDAAYRTLEACMADQGAKAPAQLSSWSCVPPQTSAGFEQCLAAIRGERCETTLGRADRLVACRSDAVCGR